MNRESEQYCFARIEAYRITPNRLEEQFKERAINLEEMEAAVAEQLAKETLCAPWRRSETELAGCREGMRLCRPSVSFAVSGGNTKSQLEPLRIGAVSTAQGIQRPLGTYGPR
jgi:hypothetical protein